MSSAAAGSHTGAARRAALSVLAFGALALAGCASTGQVAPRTLTVEVSTDPSSVRGLNIYLVPIRGGGGSPAGDPIFLGTIRARDLASFEFDTDRMGGYRLYATSGEVRVVAAAVDRNIVGRDDAVSRTFYVRPDTERIIWDLATERLLVR